MRLRNVLKICLVLWKSKPHYKRYAYKKMSVGETEGQITACCVRRERHTHQTYEY